MTEPRAALLIESDYFEPEIWYYQSRFKEAGIRLDMLTRLWGMPSMTFTGHEWKVPLEVSMSFEDVDDDALLRYDVLMVPSGMVSDRLRYTEDVNKVPPATDFLRRAFEQPGILKGIICHGLWLAAPMPELVRGRRLTCHNNLIGDARNMGAVYEDEDLVVDGDLVTARTGKHAHLFAHQIIEMIGHQQPVAVP